MKIEVGQKWLWGENGGISCEIVEIVDGFITWQWQWEGSDEVEIHKYYDISLLEKSINEGSCRLVGSINVLRKLKRYELCG